MRSTAALVLALSAIELIVPRSAAAASCDEAMTIDFNRRLTPQEYEATQVLRLDLEARIASGGGQMTLHLDGFYRPRNTADRDAMKNVAATREALARQQVEVARRLETDDGAYDALQDVDARMTSQEPAYLTAAGVGFSSFRSRRGRYQVHAITPVTQGQALNRLAHTLMTRSQTLVVLDHRPRSYFKENENTLHLALRDVAAGTYGTAVAETFAKTRSLGIVEHLIRVGRTSADEIHARTSPENARPGQLTFLSSLLATPTVEFVDRLAYRTDTVRSLSSQGIRDHLSVMPRIPRQTDQIVISYLLRNADGTWPVSTMPQAVARDKAEALQSLQNEGFAQIRARLPKTPAANEGDRPDLFIVFTGQDLFTPHDSQFLKQFVGTRDLNSVSVVLVSPSQKHGLIYRIVTIDAVRGFWTTVAADQLQGPYNRIREIRELPSTVPGAVNGVDQAVHLGVTGP